MTPKASFSAQAQGHFAGHALQVLDIKLAATGGVENHRKRLVEDLLRREAAGVEIREAPGEQVLARGGDKALIENPVDALDAAGAVRDVARQEPQNLDDVRGVLRGQALDDPPADEDPQRILDVERPEDAALLAVEPLLLEEREQAGHEVQFQVVLLRSLVEIEDLVVLAEAVAVEIAVRVVAQRALGVQLGELGAALDRLPEGGRVLEGESFLAQRIASAHPRAFFPSAGAAVPFIHEHQVVPLEGVDGDGPVTHLVAQPGHFQDLHRLTAEQPAAVLVEKLSSDARRLELAQVLLREPFVGRKQEDAVQLAPPAVLGQGVLVLQDVGVHQQRLAAAGGHPEGKLV